MNLLVDLGNTRLKWRARGPGGGCGAVALSGEWGRVVKQQWGGLKQPDRVVCVSVQSPTIEKALNELITGLWGIETARVPSLTTCCGVTNGYTDPSRLGKDRLMAMVGARDITRSPVVIVDCGTAVTIDLLDSEGRHRGGWILPGLTLMKTALVSRAAALPQTVSPGGQEVDPHFGIDTETGMREGVRAAVLGAVVRALDLAAEQVGITPDCLITGGDGNIVAAALGGRCRYVPELVLSGLARYADENFAE